MALNGGIARSPLQTKAASQRGLGDGPAAVRPDRWMFEKRARSTKPRTVRLRSGWRGVLTTGVAMSSVRRIAICLVASIGLLLVSVSAASAEPSGVPFTVGLTGEAEVTPRGGDPDGSGTATVTINPGLEEVCWTIEVAQLDTVFMAHIHVGASTTTGPVVVHFNPHQGGCSHIDRDLALAIITDPSAYYVNVHTTTFEAGAVRGQLDRPGMG
jgi:hypothetical protein